VQHDPEAEDVGAPVHRQPADHLRAHVAELAAEDVVARPAPERRLRDPEVDDAYAPVEPEQDVRGRDVAVDDPQLAALRVSPPVGVIEGVGEAPRDVRGERHRQPHAARARAVHERAQVPPRDVVHRHVVARVVAADLVDGHDAGVLELHLEAGLVEEHPNELLVVGERREDALHGVEAPGRIAGTHGREDLRHPPDRHAIDEQEASERDGFSHRRVRPGPL